MSIELSILTLNIWGIPWISTDREVRVRAIADQLLNGAFDVVSLQEVWSVSDFEYIRDRIVGVLPYSHYFFSGVLGSGLCVFSRHPIVSTLFHVWTVNGYVHRLHHGDWFGGKGVGLCRLNVGGSTVHVYVTHLHAEYDRENDDYKVHRVIQAFDTAQFIEATRGTAVMQILAGDLNTEPGDLAYRILLSVARLRDACTLLAVGTNECQHNAYTSATARKLLPTGKRIDYVMYRSGVGVDVQQAKYSLPFPQQLEIADADKRKRAATISLSDHEAVLVKFRVQQQQRRDSGTAESTGDDLARIGKDHGRDDPKALLGRLLNNLSDCIYLCDETLKLLRSHRTFYLSAAVAFGLVLVSIMDATAPYGFQWLFIGSRVALSGLVLFALFMGTLWNWMEANAVLGGRSAMQIVLKAAGVAAEEARVHDDAP